MNIPSKIANIFITIGSTALIVACGAGSDTDGSGQSFGQSARNSNVIVEVRGEQSSNEAHCTLYWSVSNRQNRDLNVMLEGTARTADEAAQLSSPTYTVALRAPAGGTGQYPGYSMSGAACSELELAVTRFMCFGGDECRVSYRSSNVSGLKPPAENY